MMFSGRGLSLSLSSASPCVGRIYRPFLLSGGTPQPWLLQADIPLAQPSQGEMSVILQN